MATYLNRDRGFRPSLMKGRCPIISDLFYFIFLVSFFSDIINASIDLSMPTNIRETPAPNKIPPIAATFKFELRHSPFLKGSPCVL